MNIHDRTRRALAAALSLLALAACDHAQREAGGEATFEQKADRALARTQEQLARVGESIEHGAQQVKPALESVGEKVKEAAASDAAITASIEADYLKDPDLSAFKIDVDTKDGVVTLNGVADSPSARQRAERLAAANKGVREVRNLLELKRS